MVDEAGLRYSLANRLGARLAALRKLRGRTQAELAELVGVDTETISRFERGVALPSLVTLDRVSQSLQVGVGELLAESTAQLDDQVSLFKTWIAGLDEADRGFVLDLIKSTCSHLRGRRSS